MFILEFVLHLPLRNFKSFTIILLNPRVPVAFGFLQSNAAAFFFSSGKIFSWPFIYKAWGVPSF